LRMIQPIAAAERETGETGVGHDAGGHREPELLRLAIELTQQHTRLSAGRPRHRVDPYPPHRAEIDHRAVVAHRESGEAVTTAAHGDHEAVLAREPRCGPDIGDPGASGDETRMAIDRAVPDLAVLVVPRISRADHVTCEGCVQVVHGCVVDRSALSHRAHARSHRRWPISLTSTVRSGTPLPSQRDRSTVSLDSLER
jgi:hypothetical protein